LFLMFMETNYNKQLIAGSTLLYSSAAVLGDGFGSL